MGRTPRPRHRRPSSEPPYPFWRPTTLAERLFTKVQLPLTSEGIPTDDPEQCWLFTGNHTGGKYGYGQIHEGATKGSKRLIKAHRAAFQVLYGLIPTDPATGKSLEICHACDVILCINAVRHLYADTHQRNMGDYVKKYGGIARPKSPLTLDQLSLALTAGRAPVAPDLADLLETLLPQDVPAQDVPAEDEEGDEDPEDIPF